MILFFDCETTGLPDFNKRARDPFETCVLRTASLLEVFVLEVRVYPSLMR